MLDAAKAMRLFHENPELTLRELTLPFLDARKRVAHYPRGRAPRSGWSRCRRPPGTGSEVSPAAVLTVGGRKVTLVDYSLVPDVAIVDPRLTLTMPPALTADTGVDALTHALEACVSIFASPYTDAFCLQALHLILDALPRAVRRRLRPRARAPTWPTRRRSPGWRSPTRSSASTTRSRTRSARASASPTGAPTAIFLPHVLRYNAALPRKFMPAPGYGAYVAPEKYAQMAWVLGLGGHGEEERARAALRARRRRCSTRSACRARSPTLGVDARRVRRGAARAGRGRVPRPEPAHQPAHAAARRARARSSTAVAAMR